MKLLWTDAAWQEYLYWQEVDHTVLTRINELLRDVKRNPFKGLGKPEPLKENMRDHWSRRITAEHRLIYRVAGGGDTQHIEIVQCRYHY